MDRTQDPSLPSQLLATAEWAIYHRLNKIADETLKELVEREVSLPAEISMRLIFQEITDLASSLSYSDETLFNNLLVHIKSLEPLIQDFAFNKYEWFSILRDTVKQAAIALLAKQFLKDRLEEPDSPDDVIVPKGFDVTAFQSTIGEHFQVYTPLYDGYDRERELDIQFFTVSGILKEVKKGRGKNQQVKLTPDKVMIYDLFSGHTLDSFQKKLLEYFVRLEDEILPSPGQKLASLLNSDVNMDALAEEEWSASKAKTKGPYASPAKQVKAKPVSHEEETFLSPSPQMVNNAQRQTPGSVASINRTRPSSHAPPPQPAKKKVEPGLLSAKVRNLNEKYDATDPLKEVLGKDDKSTKQATIPSASIRTRRATANKIDRFEPEDFIATQKQASPKPVVSEQPHETEKPRKKSISDGRSTAEKIAFEDGISNDIESPEEQLQKPKRKETRKNPKVNSSEEGDVEDICDSDSDEGLENGAASLLKLAVRDFEKDKKKRQLPDHLSSPNPSEQKKQKVEENNETEGVRIKWTFDEEEALLEGVRKYGVGQWNRILTDSQFGKVLRRRTNINLKDKYRNLERTGRL